MSTKSTKPSKTAAKAKPRARKAVTKNATPRPRRARKASEPTDLPAATPREFPEPTGETLDAIADAMAPVARVVCVPRLAAPLPPNAAELWGSTLPSASELAIVAERRARDARTDAPVGELQGPVTILVPLPRTRSALADAARNASLVSAAVLLAVFLARVVLFR